MPIKGGKKEEEEDNLSCGGFNGFLFSQRRLCTSLPGAPQAKRKLRSLYFSILPDMYPILQPLEDNKIPQTPKSNPYHEDFF
jgi:hypothetical protein